jgi:GNAT superfamily N-acetyltransferase
MEIRPFAEDDATDVVALELELKPHQVVTVPGLLHEIRHAPARERRRDWVASEGGRVVGHAVAGFNWTVPTEGKGWAVVKVRPAHRRRGIGSELFTLAEEHLRGEGAVEHRSWTHHADGRGFLERRGFRPSRMELVSAVELAAVDLSGLGELERAKAADGLRLAPLAAVSDRRGLHAVYAAGEEDMPADEPETELDFETWVVETLEHPALSEDGSTIVLAGERPVALAFLALDRERGLGYNEMTATLPEFRRRGLALLAKLAVLRWAAVAGLERVLTENDGENAAMLALNRRLGYEQVLLEQQYLRS